MCRRGKRLTALATVAVWLVMAGQQGLTRGESRLYQAAGFCHRPLPSTRTGLRSVRKGTVVDAFVGRDNFWHGALCFRPCIVRRHPKPSRTVTMASTSRQQDHDFFTSDHAIISLFVEWIAAVNAYASFPAEDPDAGFDALVDAATALADKIAETPAFGLDGIAIKSYLALRVQFGADGSDFGIDWNGGMRAVNRLERSLLADLVRVCPLLKAVVPAFYLSSASS